MKLFQIVGLAIVTAALVAGCGRNSPDSNADAPLSVTDLALLTDFHAWKVHIPQKELPVKAIRLVVINQRDGTSVTKFSTTSSFGSWTNMSILLGVRVDGKMFTGHLLAQDGKDGGMGWDLNFKDSFADLYPAWESPGTLYWNGNRAQLASSTLSNNFDNVLAIELVK
jgi:hypothetical protein